MAFQKSFCALVAILAAGSASAQDRISTAAFKAGVDNGSYDMILDVRSQEEWNGGHIPGAIHIPIDAFSKNEFWQTMDDAGYSCKSSCATIVAHCSVGGRAESAIKKLREMGFEGTLLNGQGTNQWVDAGYSLTTEDDSVEPTCVTTDICPSVETDGDTNEIMTMDGDEADTAMESSAGKAAGIGAAIVVPSLLAML